MAKSPSAEVEETLTDAEIAYNKRVEAVKKEHPEVEHSIEIPGTDLVCFLRGVDRGTLEMALGFTIKVTGGNAEIIRAGETILLTCWVDGDEEIKKDKKHLITASLAAYRLVNAETGVLKKI